LSLVPVVFMRSAFPTISTASIDANDMPLRMSASCYRYLFVLSFPVIFGGILFGSQTIRVVYGDSYSPAATALPWLLLAEVPVIAGTVYGQFSLAAKLQKFDVLFTTVNCIVNITLCVLLIPKIGLVGAAIASLIGYGISIPCQLLFTATRPYSVVLLREVAR